MTEPITYKSSGVDIDAQDEALKEVRSLAKATFNSDTLSELGSFGGLYRGLFPHMEEPVLVASADGVGTKLKLAFLTDVHDTVGRDLVNHCVNDILVQGARPMFFLDYIASGKLKPGVVVDVVKGLADACKENQCVLLGGETAEMPGFYSDGEYDVAGFVVGVVDKPKLIDGSRVVAGDKLVAIPSVGLHTNGYSLARKVYFEKDGLSPDSEVPELGESVAKALLREHPSYLAPLSEVLENPDLKGLAHITGGGLTDNIPRILPKGLGVNIQWGSWTVHPLCQSIMDRGGVERDEMLRATNMGVGMVLVVSADQAEFFQNHLKSQGHDCPVIGEVVAGEGVSYV